VNFLDFSYLLFDHIYQYLLCLVVVVIVMFPLLKKNYVSIIDPWFTSYIFSVFANIIPLFLYCTGNCSIIHFSYFVISELAFWIGYNTFRRGKSVWGNFKFKYEEKIQSYMYYVMLVLNTCFYLIKYIVLPKIRQVVNTLN
jgi:hypothetical protein